MFQFQSWAVTLTSFLWSITVTVTIAAVLYRMCRGAIRWALDIDDNDDDEDDLDVEVVDKGLTPFATGQSVTLLACDCGDCRHWEILENSIICKTCGKEFPVPGLEEIFDEHVELHPDLNWKEHVR